MPRQPAVQRCTWLLRGLVVLVAALLGVATPAPAQPHKPAASKRPVAATASKHKAKAAKAGTKASGGSTAVRGSQKPHASKPATTSHGRGALQRTGGSQGDADASDDDTPLSAKEQRQQARKRAAMRKNCAHKDARNRPKCKAFFAEEKAAADEQAQQRLEAECDGKKARKLAKCKALRAGSARVSGDSCGRKYGYTRKRDTVGRFAARYGVSEATVRSLNDLSGARTLKAGRRLLIAKSPHDGVTLSGGVQLKETVDLRLRRPHLAWGKPLLVEMLRVAAEVVQNQSPLAPKLLIGDLSKEGGGCLPPHKSHRGGLDVDVGYYFRGAFEAPHLVDARPRTIDADRSWQLLKALLLTGRVQYAFVHYSLQPALFEAAERAGDSPDDVRRWVQYPRPIDQTHVAPLRHLDGHDDHFHLRLRCEDDNCGLTATALERLRTARIETLGGPVAEGHRGRRGAAIDRHGLRVMR